MTTQAPIDPRRTQPNQRAPHVEVYWKAVTYKTVIAYILLAAAILCGGVLLAKPDLYSAAVAKLNSKLSNVTPEPVEADQKNAKFVNLDGKVQVKKVNSVQWVKADTLVTVEENSTDNSKPTSVAVRINVGQVDLVTPTWSQPDSKAAVSVEDATAHVRSNSRAAVKADPETKSSEIVVSSGSARIQRGEERIDLVLGEKVTIPKGGAIQKSNVLAPPELVEPLNLAPIIAENPKTSPVRFEWKPVPDAVSYTLRVSTTAMFTKIVKEEKVIGTSKEISGLDAGDYFWNVTAVDAKKQISDVGAPFKFSLVAQGKSQEMMLEITGTQLHGRVAEIVGRTEPGAALIMNGQPVPNIAPDGTFRHFTEALDPGQHTIVVIGQNRRGGTTQKQVSIVVPK